MYRPPVVRVRPLLLAAAVALCMAAPGRLEAQSVMTEITPKRMTTILASMGLEASEAPGAAEGEQAPLMLELGGYRALLLLLNENTDGQLYMVFDGDGVSAREINEWNRDRRFGRAYLDDEGDAVLEYDLDFAGGVTEETVKAWVRLFRDIAFEYARYVD